MGADLEQTVLSVGISTPKQQRAAAVHCADRIAAGVLELLDVLGLITTKREPEGAES